MADFLDTLASVDAARCLLLTDAPSGLRAAIVLDDLTLGPAAGGVRTRAYASLEEAVRDAAALARAMTLKCALAGLAAGGGKAVVLDHPGLDRDRAFEVLGARVEELGGLFRTAGDLGTTSADLSAMARRTRYVHLEETDLAAAVGRGLLRCVEVCAGERGVPVTGLRAAVQGCGAIGAASARALAGAGVKLLLADVVPGRAEALAAELGAEVAPPEEILAADVDLLAPCAVGGVLDVERVRRLSAWAVCGGANNILASPAAGEELHRRGVLHVPDVISSAGAVVAGIARSVMNMADPTPMIDRLGETARAVLREAKETGIPAARVAEALARRRIDESRARR